MDYIDIVAMLRQYGGVLKDVTVYGKITRVLPKPNNLFENVHLSDSNRFVEMQLFGVDLTTYSQHLKSLGITQPDNIYMVNGSISIFVDCRYNKMPDWYKIRGTLRFGTKTGYPYVTMFNFRKSGSVWRIEPNTLANIDMGCLQVDTSIYLYLSQCRLDDSVVLSKEVQLLPRFFSEPQQYMNAVPQSTNSLAQQTQEALNGVIIPTQVQRKRRIETNLKSRETVSDYSDLAVKLESVLTKAELNKREFVSSLKEDYSKSSELNKYTEAFIRRIGGSFSRKPSQRAMTGKMIVKNYLKYYDKLANAKYLGMTAEEYIIMIFDEVVHFMQCGTRINAEGNAWQLCRVAFGDPNKFYLMSVAPLLGLSAETMLETYTLCSDLNIDLCTILNENPYMLQYLAGFKYSEVERVALLLGIANKAELQSYRNVAMLNSFVEGKDVGNTVFTIEELQRKNIGVTLTQNEYDLCKSKGYYVSDNMLANVVAYINPNVQTIKIDTRGFERKGRIYVQTIGKPLLDKAILDYVDFGLGVEYEKYITSSMMLKKELYVYKYLYNLGQSETGFTAEEIDKYVDEYEKEVGFTLEKEQRTGVHLLKYEAGCVSGSAGSGKTTTSNCFVYVIKKILGDAVVFKFATPTGKAAKRLQEVVKQPVKTMNSMFKVGVGEQFLLSKSDDNYEEDTDCYYFFDECAMATLDLLYACLTRIGDGRIYLFGDFHQLPPIGKGLPFRNLLRFMPCVFLTVSKRAAEGSDITYNSDVINEHSEPDDWLSLKSGKDFFLGCCPQDNLQLYTVMLCKYFLKTASKDEIVKLQMLFKVPEMPILDDYTPDDIQVVSPLAVATYPWGATKLNTLLQPVFNKNTGYEKTLLRYSSTYADAFVSKFLLGDRVIHSRTNMYSMQWYSTYKNGSFQKIYGNGINNGEVGKIVAFYPAKTCSFENEIEAKPDDFDYPESIRDDSNIKDDESWFVVVEYYDYMQERNFYIIYRCKESATHQNNTGVPLIGEDLNKLDLFYAGTTHKMQGSQAKVIISVLGVVNYNGFITRNMMYTVYTRGVKLVFALGSVGNELSSQLSRARKEVSEDGVLTVGELLYSD